MDDKAPGPSREKLAADREDAVGLREKAVDVREGNVTTDQREIRAAEMTQGTSDDQVSMLRQANAQLAIATLEAHSLAEQVQTALADLDHLAHHDVLTNLPNRLLLNDRLVQAIARAHRQGKQLAVMFLDLDRFKHINDSLGHAVGDRLLQSVGQRLLDCVHQSDTISRLGGDEFLLLLPDTEHAEDVALSAQKMLRALARPHLIDPHDLQIGASIGISIYPDDGQDAETLIKHADIAMFHAKESGRNNYKFFEQHMDARAVQRQLIETGLRRALERQEFVLHYQPKVNFLSGTIVGIEALVRWQHPQHGLVPPAQFVPVAEDSGLILPLGRWVLREACFQARAWQDAGLPPIIVAVNISALEFRAGDFLEYLRATLEESRLEPRYLELELTESVLMRDAATADSVLHSLADLGVKLAIDDFGTGYSSLSYLRQFPINTLKIDQSFVNEITSNPDDATIVSAVISMGKSLKLHVIAEGVETAEQAAFLLAQHCDEGQGYFFGRPMTAEALAVLLQTGVSPALQWPPSRHAVHPEPPAAPRERRATGGVRDLAQRVSEKLERGHQMESARELILLQARYSAIITASDDAIISKTLDGIITTWNPAAENLFGYPGTAAIGQPMTMLFPPERVGEEAEIIARIGRGERVEHFETVRLRRDGTRVDVSVSISPITDAGGRIVGASNIGRDITARNQAEAAARASSQLVKSILDTVVDGIITIDSQGTVLSCNPAAERLFGYTQAEMINRNVKGLMPEPYAAEYDAYLANYLKTGEARVIGIGREVKGQRKDGSTFPMEVAISEMPQADQTLFVGIVRDITERKQIERMKSGFVSTVSHELRTPLTSIRGALGLVLGKYSSGLSDKARQLLDTANRNSERLTLLINDILDLEKIESDRLEFEFKTTDLAAVARQAMVANEGYGHQHAVLLQLVETPERAMVQADENRLLQVFANLISNAVKYSPAGGTVKVAVGWQEGRFRVNVCDQGPGIPAEFRSRMFQRFAQADSSDTRQKGGTGLGLSITKAIVERHGGSIGFDSEEGVGTDFYFELPEWREIIEQSSGATDRPTMLICEDDVDAAMMLAELLEQGGVASDRVATAAGALEMLKRKQYRALLLDLGLPDMDGLRLIQHLRGNTATRKLPVIVVSGQTREDIANSDGQALSVLDWLEKPVDRARLDQALNQALQRPQRPHILHVEDDADVIHVTQALLEEDADYTYATSLAAARLALAESQCDLLLLDLTLPDGSGMELLDAISPDTKVVVFSGQNPSAEIRQHVTAALIKGGTSNDRLLATIKQVSNQIRA